MSTEDSAPLGDSEVMMVTDGNTNESLVSGEIHAQAQQGNKESGWLVDLSHYLRAYTYGTLNFKNWNIVYGISSWPICIS